MKSVFSRTCLTHKRVVIGSTHRGIEILHLGGGGGGGIGHTFFCNRIGSVLKNIVV